MQHSFRFLIALMGLLVLAACTLPRGAAIQSEVVRSQNTDTASFAVVPIKPANIAQLRTWPATGWAGHYHWFSGTSGPRSNVIRTGDKVDLVIWDSQVNSLLIPASQKNVTMKDLVVSPSGTIFVPYIDEVRISGSSPDQARRMIETELERVVPDAQVQLTLQSGPDNSVDAVRGFASPGSYPLPNRNYSLLSLIAAADGISSDLENPLVRVIRAGKTYEIRADILFQRASANVILRGGDKVIAQEDDRYFAALGATGSETIVPFSQEHMTAVEALALLGGINDARANPKGILILRDYSAKQVRADGTGPSKQQVVFSIDLTSAEDIFAARKFYINPKDLVLATESPVNSVRTVFGLIGSAVGVGNALDNN
ncbi:polysaccharide biosynthesis/export family protein [uncultured Tateyamaria sp.]|uniref:polysaccharide biosynthesis/export family protein n=1 Tax=uncultured Tateyamaria sp. TaxID=455651 RepID=UPI00261D48DD|nr:polysaccharide biosynthesis/export family protein [uncultured Tateyamaria sp.]